MDFHTAIRQSLDLLYQLVAGTFGPNGGEKLLFNPPNPPIITSCGTTILHHLFEDKIPPQSFALRFLLNHIRAITKLNGDGSTQLILMLRAGFDSAVLAFTDSKYEYVQLAKTFALLNYDDSILKDTVVAHLRKYNSIATKVDFHPQTRQPSQEIVQVSKKIVHTALDGIFSADVVMFLTDLLVDWIYRGIVESEYLRLPEQCSELNDFFQYALSKVKDNIISAPHASLDCSRVINKNDFLLRKSICPMQSKKNIRLQMPFRFICFQCQISFGVYSGSNSVTIKTTNERDYINAIDYSLKFIRNYVKNLVQVLKVSCIICTEAISEQFVEVCNYYHVTCIQYVEIADMNELCSRANIFILSELVTPSKIKSCENIGCINGDIREISMGGTGYLYFQNLQFKKSNTLAIKAEAQIPQLILRGMTLGICKEYQQALYKGIRSLIAWTASCSNIEEDTMYCTGGGGSAEFSIVGICEEVLNNTKIIEMHGEKIGQAYLKIALRVLIDSLMQIPHHLQINLTGKLTQESKINVNRIFWLNFTKTPCERNIGYVFTSPKLSSGNATFAELKLGKPIEMGILHPLNRTTTLLSYFLSVMETIFRIDFVLEKKTDTKV